MIQHALKPHQPTEQLAPPHLRLASAPVDRVGPNAITRLAEALDAGCGRMVTEKVFGAAGLAHRRATPPASMVDEREVIRLHHALRDTVDESTRAAMAFDAGRRTGDYLLAHRIPRLAQWVLRHLRPKPAANLLLRAIGKHAWTFAGSGNFSWTDGSPLVLTLEHCPLARGVESPFPACDFYTGTFQRLFEVLVSPSSTVSEVACEAMGAPACRFEVRWH